jgi:hypothetical protein
MPHVSTRMIANSYYINSTVMMLVNLQNSLSLCCVNLSCCMIILLDTKVSATGLVSPDNCRPEVLAVG